MAVGSRCRGGTNHLQHIFTGGTTLYQQEAGFNKDSRSPKESPFAYSDRLSASLSCILQHQGAPLNMSFGEWTFGVAFRAWKRLLPLLKPSLPAAYNVWSWLSFGYLSGFTILRLKINIKLQVDIIFNMYL